MDDSATNNFNFIAGVIGFVVTVASTALCCRAYLPGAQMKILDELLKETRSIHEKAHAEDLFPSDDFRKVSSRKLAEMEESSAPLRERTYNATTTFQEYMALFHGLSQRIMHLSACVKALRACLISTSEKKRRRRQGNNEQSAHLNDNPMVDASMSRLTSIDSSIDSESESNLRSQQGGRGSETHEDQSASCLPVLSESDQSADCLREDLAQLREDHRQGVGQDNVAPLNNPSRSSTLTTLVDAIPSVVFYKTLDRLCRWMSIHCGKGILDPPPLDDQDVARLPV